MKKSFLITCLSSVCLFAHFGVVLPSKAVVENQDDKSIELNYAFMHPFEQSYMKLEKPQRIGVFSDDKITDLSKNVVKKGDVWVSDFTIKKPSIYHFFMEPVPYFEPSEGKFIQHLTKSIVDGFGAGDGWDEAIGLKAEIIPLTRPYGLYEGNLFRGKVLYKGSIAKNCEVEVEFYNTKGFKSPSDAHITQVVKTDENGIFAFAMPKAGWWGFAALLDDDVKIKKDGKDYPLELGGVLWVKVDKLEQ